MRSTYYSLVICLLILLTIKISLGQEIRNREVRNYKIQLEELYNKGERFDSILYLLNQIEILSIEKNLKEEYVYSLLAGANIANIINDYESKNCFLKRSYNEGLTLISTNHIYVPSIYSNYSDYYSSIGDYLKANSLLEAAIKNLKKLPFGSFRHKNTISILLNLGQVKGNLGDFNESIKLYSQVRKLCSDSISLDLEYKRKYSLALYNLGVDNFFNKDYKKSIHYLKMNLFFLSQNLSISNEISNRTYISLANSYQSIDSSKKGLSYLEKVSFEGEDSSLLGNYHNVKARCLIALNKYSEAEKEIDKAIKWTRKNNPELKKKPLLGYYLKTKAELFTAQKAFNYALNSYQLSIENFLFTKPQQGKPLNKNDFQVVDNYVLDVISNIIDMNLKLFSTKKSQGFLHNAHQNSQLLIQLIDRYRKQLQTLDAQLFISNELRPAFEQAIEISLMLHELTGEQKYLDEAFGLTEKGKAVLLSNALNDTYAKYSGGVPDSLLAEERELKANISFYKNLIFKEENKKEGIDSLKIDRWERKLFELEREQEDFDKMLAQNYSDYHEYLNQEETVNIADIQRNLDHNTSLIEFFAGDSSLYIFFLDRDKLTYKEIPNPNEIYNQLDELSNSIRSEDSTPQSASDFSKSAFFLFKELLSDKIKDYQKLIFIPDGHLGKIPFEFLLTSEENSSSFKNLAYLGDKYDIQYAYSAKLLFKDPLKRRRQTSQKLWAGFAPYFEGEKRLVFNGQEVEGINEFMKGDIFMNEQANLKQTKAIIDQYKILHFATHGYSQMERPMYSRIEFTYQDSLADGVFYAHDLMNHKINADLVVLSACETGEGKVAKGEGIMSFAWAFRYAGAPSILMSLWKAESSVSQRIMLSFYKYLKEGNSKSEALRLAKQDYIQNPIPGREHPKYWANFILIGDDAPIFVDPKLNWIALAGLVLFMVLVIMAIYQRPKSVKVKA